MDELEERFYEAAAAELAAQNPAPGIMAKALVEPDGDEKKAIAHYISLRVAQLKTQHFATVAAERERRRKDRSDKRAQLWTACPHCSFEGSMAPSFIPGPDHRLFEVGVRCPRCGHRFDWYYIPPRDGARDGQA